MVNNAIGSMRIGFAWRFVILAGICIVLPIVGCKKQSSAGSQATTSAFESLPEATNVTAALDQKDYETALSSLAKLKESVSSEEQQKDYRLLIGQVKERILEASASDPKAADALRALQILISGR